MTPETIISARREVSLKTQLVNIPDTTQLLMRRAATPQGSP